MRCCHPDFRFHPDRPCWYWSSVENSSIFSAIRLPLYLTISLSPTIVLARSVDRAMHYSSVSFMSLQSWALSKGEQSRNTINQALSDTRHNGTRWLDVQASPREWKRVADLSVYIEIARTLFTPATVELHWYSAPQPMKYPNQPSQKRSALWSQPGSGWPTIATHWDSSPYWQYVLLNPVAGLIMSL